MNLENCTGYPEMPKDSSECVKLLRQFNEWRRWIGAAPLDEEGPAMPHPKSIGFAIDMAIRLIEERNELLSKVGAWEQKAANWMASPEAAQRLEGYRDIAQRLNIAEQQRDNLLAFVERVSKQKVEPYFAKEAAYVIASVKGGTA